jgi:bifunctional non-homologous end joining protein LigD
VTWDEIGVCEPEAFTLKTVPARFAEVGDRHADIDNHPCSLEGLLELSARHEKEGQGDAPWPPHYRKQAGEPARVQPSRRRVPKHPLIEIARAQKKEDALAGLERWKARHPEAAGHLEPADVLVDAMRGRFHTWTRIRINLQHVPEAIRPPQEALDPDDPFDWSGVTADSFQRRRPSRARKPS